MNNGAENVSGRWEFCPADVCQGRWSFPKLFHFYTLPMLITYFCNTYTYISHSYVCIYVFRYIYLHSYIFLIYFFLYI